jgi:glycerate kinase
VGQLISSALDQGATDVLIGLGGSATNDGGTGMFTAPLLGPTGPSAVFGPRRVPRPPTSHDWNRH